MCLYNDPQRTVQYKLSYKQKGQKIALGSWTVKILDLVNFLSPSVDAQESIKKRTMATSS